MEQGLKSIQEDKYKDILCKRNKIKTQIKAFGHEYACAYFELVYASRSMRTQTCPNPNLGTKKCRKTNKT